MEPGESPTRRDRVPAQRTPPGPPRSTPAATRPGLPARRAKRLRNRRLRAVLAVLGGVLALLCLGGIAAVYLLYEDATAVDRSAPDVAVDNYLRAYLVERDDARADQYVCREAPDLTDVRALRDDIEARERRYSVRILVTWDSLRVEPAREGRTVTTEVRRTIADGSERIQDRWQFQVVDRDGWRVCAARRLS